MKIDRKSLVISRTFNLGNYENIKIEAGVEVIVEPGDYAEKVERAMITECREFIKAVRVAHRPKKEPTP